MTSARVLRASPRGDGCGLVLVSLGGGASLTVSVLPKWWRAASPSPVEVPIDVAADGQLPLAHVWVTELEHLVLHSRDARRLDACVRALVSVGFPAEDAEDEAAGASSGPAPLFVEVPTSSGGGWSGNGSDLPDRPLSAVEAFWSMVSTSAASDLVRIPAKDGAGEPPLTAYGLIDDVPSLERIMRELLVTATEAMLRRRQPDFRARTESLPFVRGSLTRSGRLQVALRSVANFECEFSAIDHDHPWQRVVRSAVRQVASRDLADSAVWPAAARVRRCRVIDQRMIDVTAISGRQALSYGVSANALGKNRHASPALRLALAVLARENPGGYTDHTSTDAAAATGLRISSSRLLERMLAMSLQLPFHYRLVENIERIAIHEHGRKDKLPDLLLVRTAAKASGVHNATAVIDAKNKQVVPNTPGQMEMKDQYQQFAYAATTALPTLFLFAAPCGTSPHVSAPTNIVLPSSDKKVPVAVGRVPYPAPDATDWRDEFSSGVRAVIKGFLDAIAAHSEAPLSP